MLPDDVPEGVTVDEAPTEAVVEAPPAEELFDEDVVEEDAVEDVEEGEPVDELVEAEPATEGDPTPEEVAEPAPAQEDDEPSDSSAAAMIASVQEAYRAGDREEAATIARLAVLRFPNDAGAHYVLAAALRRLGQDDEALEQAERAVELDPRNGQHHLLVGISTAGTVEDRARARPTRRASSASRGSPRVASASRR